MPVEILADRGGVELASRSAEPLREPLSGFEHLVRTAVLMGCV
jgi:hypothetical protein